LARVASAAATSRTQSTAWPSRRSAPRRLSPIIRSASTSSSRIRKAYRALRYRARRPDAVSCEPMPTTLRHTLLSFRDLLVTFGPFIVLAFALLAVAYWVLDPTPPSRVVLATGPD